MKHFFTFFTTVFVALSSIAPLAADKPDLEKLATERETLIDLALSLEKGFAQTLADFRQLQEEYTKLAEKKQPPHQPANIKRLQKELAKANERIRTLEEKSTSKQDSAFLKTDLVNLRNELHRERQLLLVAKAQLAKAQEIEVQNQKLTEELKKESADHKSLQTKFTTLSKEKETLIAQVDELLKKNETDQKTAQTRITQLETEAQKLIKEVETQSTELEKFRTLHQNYEESQKQTEALQKEQQKLTQLLADREKELTRLREDLATETKRALDIPVLIKARDELKTKLDESQKTSENLKNQNETLTTRQTELQTEIARVQKMIAEMQDQLGKNREAMMKAEEIRALNEKLLAEQKQSELALATAQTSIKELETKLQTFDKLETERDALRDKVTAAEPILAKAQNELAQAKTRIAAADKLEKDLADLTARFTVLESEKTTLTEKLQASTDEISKLRESMKSQTVQQETLANLEKERAAFVEQLAKKDEELKKTRQDLGKLGIRSTILENELASLKRKSITIDPVRYARGEADISGQQERIYQQIQQALELFPEARFEIVGHTCDLGNREGNQRLSEQRAKALLEFLVEKGIPADRLKSRGTGDSEPLVPNTSEANRQQNRRVDVEILD